MLIQLGYEDRTWGGFLFGRAYEGSLPWYLPAALLVKTPLGMLALWVAGSAVLLAVRRLRPAALYLLLPPAVLFAVATLGARNFGTRYVIVVPIFLAVAAAAVTVLRRRWVARGRGGARGLRRRELAADVSRTTCRTATRPSADRRPRRGTCTTRTSTGARTWVGSPTGSGSGIPDSRSGSPTRAAACRPRTASRPATR